MILGADEVKSTQLFQLTLARTTSVPQELRTESGGGLMVECKVTGRGNVLCHMRTDSRRDNGMDVGCT